MYDPELDMVSTLRAAYRAVRQHGTPARKALAYYAWRRLDGPRPTTFLVASDGTAWRYDRASLLAELRLLMLQQGMPVGFVARFDRSL